MEGHCLEIQKQMVKAHNRLALLQTMSGNAAIEDRIMAATNYEFGLRIMQKQLEDQLIYIGEGDRSLISTVQFQSIEELCKTMLGMIGTLIETSNKK